MVSYWEGRMEQKGLNIYYLIKKVSKEIAVIFKSVICILNFCYIILCTWYLNISQGKD